MIFAGRVSRYPALSLVSPHLSSFDRPAQVSAHCEPAGRHCRQPAPYGLSRFGWATGRGLQKSARSNLWTVSVCPGICVWPPPKCATSPMCNGGTRSIEKISDLVFVLLTITILSLLAG